MDTTENTAEIPEKNVVVEAISYIEDDLEKQPVTFPFGDMERISRLGILHMFAKSNGFSMSGSKGSNAVELYVQETKKLLEFCKKHI